MLKKQLILLSLMLVILLVFSACGTDDEVVDEVPNGIDDETPVEPGEPVETEIVEVAVTAEPASFDWHAMTAAATQQPAVQIYETLYALDRNFVGVPMLAADYPEISDDNKEYIIPLREGVMFHNGEEMTAEDVVASLERWGELSRGGGRMFQYVDAIEILDEYTIKIDFLQPYAPMVNTIATPVQASGIMPKSVIDVVGSEVIEEDEYIIGTGPYKLARWERGSHYLLERFEDYSVLDSDDGGLAGQKIAYAKEVKVNFASDPSVRLNGLLTDMYDYVEELAGEDMSTIENAGYVTQIVKPYYNRIAVLNTSKPPFDDPMIRKAAALAVDCEQVMLSITGHPDLYELDGAIYMPEHKALYTEAGTEDYNANDIDRASQLLEEAGYAGEPVVFFTTRTYDWQIKASNVVVSNLTSAGFNIQTEVMEWTTLLERRGDIESWDVVQTALGAGYMEPGTILYFTGSWPFEGFYAKDDKVDNLLSEWNEAFSPEERISLIEAMQIQLYEDQPIIKYGNEFLLNGYSPNLEENMEFYQPTFWNMWLN